MANEFKGRKVLVTGGAGFIGSHLVDSLVTEEAQVTVVDNLITGNKNNLTAVLDKIEFIQEEVAEWSHESQVMGYKLRENEPATRNLQPETYNYIFHLASPAAPIGYMNNPEATYMVNSMGTHFLTKLAVKTGARMLFASTSEAYGDPMEHPQKETYFGNVNPVGPRACYDESKRFGEMVVMNAIRNNHLDGRIVRIFNTYGPRMDPEDGRIFPSFINQALDNQPVTVHGDGLQTRSFCFVTDLVKALKKTMLEPKAHAEVLNLGNPEEHTVLEMAQKIISMVNSRSEIVFVDRPEDDPTRRQPDISKAKAVIDWEPEVTLDTGLKQTIEYFKKLHVTGYGLQESD